MRHQLATLEGQMAAVNPSDFNQTAKLHREHSQVLGKLSELELVWLTDAEELERINAQLTASGRD
jgi:hypothetical protein